MLQGILQNLPIHNRELNLHAPHLKIGGDQVANRPAPFLRGEHAFGETYVEYGRAGCQLQGQARDAPQHCGWDRCGPAR